jgi:hypothetical protein
MLGIYYLLVIHLVFTLLVAPSVPLMNMLSRKLAKLIILASDFDPTYFEQYPGIMQNIYIYIYNVVVVVVDDDDDDVVAAAVVVVVVIVVVVGCCCCF